MNLLKSFGVLLEVMVRTLTAVVESWCRAILLVTALFTCYLVRSQRESVNCRQQLAQMNWIPTIS